MQASKYYQFKKNGRLIVSTRVEAKMLCFCFFIYQYAPDERNEHLK